VKLEEVDPPYAESPLYVATMVMDPTGKVLVVHVACQLDPGFESVCAVQPEIDEPFAVNPTVPDPSFGATVAVKVTA